MKTIDLELGATLDNQKIKLGHRVLEGTTRKLRQEISSERINELKQILLFAKGESVRIYVI